MKKDLLVTLEEFESAEKYWMDKLSGTLSEVRFLGNLPTPGEDETVGHPVALGPHLTEKLLQKSKNNPLGMYIMLLTAFKILLFKYTGEMDIIVASPVYSKKNREYNKIVALRDFLQPAKTFKECLMTVKQTVVEGYKNEHYPIEKLIEYLELNDSVLFRNILLYEQIHEKELIDKYIDASVSDVTLSVARSRLELKGDIFYNAKLYDKEQIQNLCAGYLRILTQVLEDTGVEISRIELMAEAEKREVLFDFNHTMEPFPQDKAIHELFERQVEMTPANTAVRSAIDVNDLFAELKSGKTPSAHSGGVEFCCFKKNGYIYQTDLELAGKNTGFKILKTHQHNSVVVNRNTLNIINSFDGETNVKSLFETIKDKHIGLFIYSVQPADILEIVFKFSEKDEILLDGTFETFLQLLAVLYRNHLIEPVGANFIESRLPSLMDIHWEPGESGDKKIVSDAVLVQDRELANASVLLLGGTPGTPTTGLLYLAGYLWRRGIRAYCRFNDINPGYSQLKEEVEGLLKQVQPEVVAVSMKWFLHIARVFEICRIVKDYSHAIRVVVGGNTAAYYWEEVIHDDNVDYVIRGDGEEPLMQICRAVDPKDIPNLVYKENGEIIANPIDYVQDESHSPGIYLSNLDDILISRCAPVFGSFFVYTHKGCGMNCLYCGGCRKAQEKTFNRSTISNRRVEDVRKDIIEIKNYSSTLVFDFDASNERLINYCRRIWQGIDLSSHFCVFLNIIPPSPDLIHLVNQTFKYVYWELDLASLSERHRKHLFALGLVKPQPLDRDIFDCLDECETYDNNEVRINLINGLPYFKEEDFQHGERVLSRIIGKYRCFSQLHWGRLHAQPGAPVTREAEQHDMYSHASNFEDFLRYSQMNYNSKTGFPSIEYFNYPYIYYNDDALNSRMSKFHVDENQKVAWHKNNMIRKSIVDVDISYKELNIRADRFARLLKQRGIGSGSIVGVMLDNTFLLAAVWLGIMKAGAAYLPISPEYPRERKKFMVEDSRLQAVVTYPARSGDLAGIVSPASIILTDDDYFSRDNSETQETAAIEPGLVYVIYTSGTTGRPRGVAVEHRGIVNYTHWRLNVYCYSESDVTLQPLANSFDGFGSNFYSGLLSGGTLVMVPGSKILDIEYIKATIKKHRITNVSLVPSIYRVILDNADAEDLESLRFVVLAGETCSAALIRNSNEKIPRALLINEYGPTETTVTAIAHIGMGETNSSTIGSPIWNTHIYILNKSLEPVPAGVPGELCIAGAGVARGYLNRPELTAEKFISAPFTPHPSPIYKSGDLAKWLPDGNIEFLGRIDKQVKIRGYRVEPEEIKNQLLQHPDLKEVEVIAKVDTDGGDGRDMQEDNYLCAYVVAEAEEDISTSQLREFLLDKLPNYMVPAYFIQLTFMPLTTHGKIDQKALLAMEGIDLGDKKEYVAAGSEIEKKLVETWEQVLGREKIGIHDNFFEIGGDSIKTIQIAARMNKAGYKLQMKDIFLNPTISALAPMIDKVERISDQSVVSGTIPLTPVQWWFFKLPYRQRHHFNQSMIIHLAEGLDQDAVTAVFSKLQEHHDALRMVYREEGEQFIQVNQSLDYPFSLQVFDFRKRNDAVPALELKANDIQASIHLENGPLMKLALFRLDDGDRLLIVIHHLVIDAVSWGILFEDIEMLFLQYRGGEELLLPLKSDSFKLWSEELSRYAGSQSFLKEKAYWAALEAQEIEPIKKDFAEGSNIVKDSEMLTFALSEEETTLLLTKVNEPFATGINDILLTALGLGIKRTFGNEKVVIAMEGHGREEILMDIDMKRTVGWFTSIYPVILDLSYESCGENLSRQVKEIKESLHGIPHNGIGYGILKYLTPLKYKEDIDFKLNPQINFNYLGQFGENAGQQTFQVIRETAGNIQDRERQRQYDFEVSGVISDKRLLMSVTFGKNQYRKETVETFMHHYKKELLHIIAFCSSGLDKELTPSDLTYNKLSIETLDLLAKQYPIEDIYGLTPVQEGMVFHAVYDSEASTYFEQLSYRLQGNLDVIFIEKSINELFKYRDVLRTTFVYKGLDRPVQVVWKERKVDFLFKDVQADLEGKSEKEKKAFIKKLKKNDRRRVFDLSKDVLMRVVILRTGEAEYELVWGFHHILLDGWSMGILMSEFFQVYYCLMENKPVRLPTVTPYRTFVWWLENYDAESSKNFWKDYLHGYDKTAVLSKTKKVETGNVEYKGEKVDLVLTKEKTAALNQLALKNRVTLNTVMQAVWGIILGRYNRREDVVFSTMVSGRPAEIPDVESMLGFFMNMIPVRVRFEENTIFRDLIRTLHEEAIQSKPHHYSPLAEIQSQSLLKRNLLDHGMVFENIPFAEQMKRSVGMADRTGAELKILESEIVQQSNYDFVMIISPQEQLTIRFSYNHAVYEEELIAKIADHVKEVIDIITGNDGIKIGDIKISKNLLTARSDVVKDTNREFRF